MIRALLVVALLARTLGAAEPSEEDALRKAMAVVDSEVKHLQQTTTMPSQAEVVASVSAADREALQALTGLQANGGKAEQVRAQLRQAGIDLFGRDVLATAISAQLAPGGYRDPTPEMTFDAGKQGLLWVFWSCDAPGIAMLPAQLAEVQRTWPDLMVRDSHVMRLSDWNRFARKLWDLKSQLEQADPGVDVTTLIPARRALRDAAMPPLAALTTMAVSRRQGGYLLIEDVSAACAYDVHRLPTLVFLSPNGLVHRTTGLHPTRSIAAWINHTLTWEAANLRLLQARGDIAAPTDRP